MASLNTAVSVSRGLVFATLLVFSSARCPAYYPNTVVLQSTSGSLKYDEYYESAKWCQWSFPVFKVKDSVILLKLTSMSLYQRGCTGSFRLTGMSSFCTKPTNSCFIYSSPPLCNPQVTFDLIQNENCSDTYWVFDEATTRNIRFLSTKRAQKSFSLEYKYFSCRPSQDLTTKSISGAGGSHGDAHRNVTMQVNETAQPNDSGVPSGTFAGVIVLFLLLLAACLVLLFLLYRKLRNLKSGSRVPRVQYELAKTRDITVLQLSQAEKSNDSTFALHGEHHKDVTQHRNEAAECSYGYSVDAVLGDDDRSTRDYNSFTSDESEHSAPENGTCEYATVTKRRAQTCV